MQTSSTESTQDTDGRLLKILGVSFGVAVTIGGMIGLGILRTPGTVTAQLDSVWLVMVAWIVGGIYALFGVFQAAELGTSIPRTGGPYLYARRAFGPFPGFLVGWMDWISYPAGMALASITIGEYLSNVIPQLAGQANSVGIIALLLLGVLNWLGLRVGSRLQEVTSFLKALVFLVLIAACFTLPAAPASPGISEVIETQKPFGILVMLGAFVVALQGVIYAYDGWYAAVYFSEENENPSRSLPRSMIGGVLAVMGIYLLFNLALLHVLPLHQLSTSTLPAADAASAIFGDAGNRVVTLIAIVSLLSITNSGLLMAPRILFGLGRDGLFVSKAGTVNEGGTPVIGLAITLATAVPLIAIGTFERLLAISAFLYIGIYLSMFLSIIALRRKEPDLPRPFKAWGYPWTTLVVLAGSLAFLVGATLNDTENSIYALGIILISYPIYLVIRYLGRGNEV